MSSTSSSNSAVNDQGSSFGAPMMNLKFMLIALIIMVLIVLIVGAMHLYVRYVWVRRGYGRWEWGWDRRTDFRNGPGIAGSTGLDKHVLDALPTFVYTKESMKDPMECPVCISEFQENETGRLLPKCNHSFHTDCIDMWFQSHSTCPLCRTDVGEEHNASQADDEMPADQAGASTDVVIVDVESLISTPCAAAEGRIETNAADSLPIPYQLRETCSDQQRRQEDPKPDSYAQQSNVSTTCLQYPVNTLFYGSKNRVTSRSNSRAERFQKFEHLVIEVPNSSAIFPPSNIIAGPRTTPPTPTSTPEESRKGVSHLKTLKRILSMREKRSSVSATPKSSADHVQQEVLTPLKNLENPTT